MKIISHAAEEMTYCKLSNNFVFLNSEKYKRNEPLTIALNHFLRFRNNFRLYYYYYYYYYYIPAFLFLNKQIVLHCSVFFKIR